MAAPYLVSLGAKVGPRVRSADAVVVYADSVADARAVCKAYFGGDSDAAWAADATTVTAIAAGANLAGYRCAPAFR